MSPVLYLCVFVLEALAGGDSVWVPCYFIQFLKASHWVGLWSGVSVNIILYTMTSVWHCWVSPRELAPGVWFPLLPANQSRELPLPNAGAWSPSSELPTLPTHTISTGGFQFLSFGVPEAPGLFPQHPVLCPLLLFFEHAAMLADKTWHCGLRSRLALCSSEETFSSYCIPVGSSHQDSEKEYLAIWILGHNFFPFSPMWYFFLSH